MPTNSRFHIIALLTAGAALLSAPASAQYIGGNAPPPPPAPVAGQNETPEAALARNIRLIAINPKNYDALVGAGRAALRLGDAQAAVGFFGRAEEVHPTSWVPKAGQASALVQMMEASAALGYFAEAQRLGASQMSIALDRGLAFDLAGDAAKAQSDYRSVLNGPDANEARRRLALSLAIGGNRAEALSTLDPLLVRRDPAAVRIRAFILALTGDTAGAQTAVRTAMPTLAGSMDPFLARLTSLQPGQKAAAVHFGVMPAQGVQLAEADEGARPAPTVAPAAPMRQAPIRVAANTPRTDRLADIESALIKLPEPPPAPKPLVERVNTRIKTAAGEEAGVKAAATSAPVGKKVAKVETKATKAGLRAGKDEAPKSAKAKGKKTDEDEEDSRAPAGKSRIWVQLAGGARAERMTTEFARIKAKKPSLFVKRTAHVAELKGWSRLLVGPFKSDEDAQDFVNDLHKAGLEGFAWTSPSTQKIEKLAAK